MAAPPHFSGFLNPGLMVSTAPDSRFPCYRIRGTRETEYSIQDSRKILDALKKADELMYQDKEKYYHSNPEQRR